MKSSSIPILLLLIIRSEEASVFVGVPNVVKSDTSVYLFCDYHLDGGRLYKVTWFKDDHQFYRFKPSDRELKKTYPVPGINLDLLRSNNTHIHLNPITVASDGKYTCEAQTGPPAFRTISSGKNMRVYVLTRTFLNIQGYKDSYKRDRRINLNCISSPAYPPFQLSWKINDQDAPEEWLQRHQHLAKDEGLKVSQLGLDFEADSNQFHGKVLKLKCVGLQIINLDTGNRTIGDFSKTVIFRYNHLIPKKSRLVNHEVEDEVIRGEYKEGREEEEDDYNDGQSASNSITLSLIFTFISIFLTVNI